MLPTYVLVSLICECLFLVFHFSVTLFIACQVAKGPKLFRNAFFVLYLLQSAADVADYFTVQWLIRFPQYNIVPAAVVEPVGPFLFFATAYFQFFQCVSHTAIAVNRYTVMLDPLRHIPAWNGRSLTWILALLFLIPLVAAAVRLWFKTSIVADGEGYGLVNNAYGTDLAGGIISVTLALVTCTLSAFFEFRAVILYRHLNFQQKREHRDDFRLLIYAIIGLISQLLMAAIWFTSHVIGMHSEVGQAIVKASLPYVIDLLSLSGPLCLLVTSKTIRSRYLKFYGLLCKRRSAIMALSDTPQSQHSDNSPVFVTRPPSRQHSLRK
ncbi:hypothetical protein AAVH_10381 [Aphelenchoides avenae]|nr:hypothetical protein AAVH_10381 [Aphelenchus avenae]